MSNPILSIITINRNNAEGLRETINSVLKQKNVNQEDVEYIIIDGASVDNSVDVIKSFEDTPSLPLKISKWISEPDSGIYNAMNKGIKMATGDYLHMLNSGDFYEPNVLQNIISNLKEKPDILLCGVNILYDNIINYVEIKYPSFLSKATMNHQGLFYRRDFHKELLYDESYKYAADYDFCIKSFFSKKLKIQTIFSPCVNFIIGGVGFSGVSIKEFNSIQVKYGFAKKKKITIKDVIKWFIPSGLLLLKKNIRLLIRKRKQ